MCWPYVCDKTKWSLGARKYLSQVPSPQISRQKNQNSSRGVEKTIFLCLQLIDEITTFICQNEAILDICQIEATLDICQNEATLNICQKKKQL